MIMDGKTTDKHHTLRSRVLLLGPPAAGKSSLAQAFSRFGLAHYSLDSEVFRLCKEKSYNGSLSDAMILEAVKRFIASIPDKNPAIVELPHHDYLDLIKNDELQLSGYDCIVLLTASYATLCKRNGARERRVPDLYIARCIGGIESLVSWMTFESLPWLRFDMDLFTFPQVATSILNFLRQTESSSLSRLAIAPIPKSPYLGGHLIDAVEWDAELLEELQRRYPIRTVLDVGCGVGLSLDLFQDHGISAWGLDGNVAILDGPSQTKQRIMIVDFTKQWIEWPTKMDLVWCTEVLEHIPNLYEVNVIRTICSSAARIVFATAASSNQPGYNHVNCQPLEHWISRFEEHGLKYVEETRHILDRLTNEGPFGRNYLKENGMLFEVCL